MTCPLEHISAAGFQQLVREREEALQEVQVLDAENERLRHELKRTHDEALEEAAKELETRVDYDPELGGATIDVEEAVALIRSLKVLP